MCGRVAVKTNRSGISSMFSRDISFRDNPVTGDNIYPGMQISVIRNGVLYNIPWGILPNWASRPIINAREETIAIKSMFRNGKPVAIPVTGFYEWQKVGKQKIPWFIQLPNNSPFCLGGLDIDGKAVILTTCPKRAWETTGEPILKTMLEIHERIPVIVGNLSMMEAVKRAPNIVPNG